MPTKYGHLDFYASAALEAHDVASEYLLARNFRRVLRRQRLFGVAGFGLGRDGRKRFSDAHTVCIAVRKEPPERAVAELLAAEISSGRRSVSRSPGKKQPALSFSDGA